MKVRSRHSRQYKAHLRSPEWDRIRKAALKRAGYRCAFCGLDRDQLRRKGRHLQVHHNTYRNLGHERPEDLTVLCAGGRGGCHAVADQQRRAGSGTRKRPVRRSRGRRRRMSRETRRLARVPIVLALTWAVLTVASIALPTPPH